MRIIPFISFLPAANSSMVMRGKRISVRALPRTRRLFSGVGCSCCRCVSASAQRTAAPNRRTSLTPRVSLSNTATSVSGGKRGGERTRICYQVGQSSHNESSVFRGAQRGAKLEAAVPRSMSVKPSAARASPVFLSMLSRQRLASCGSSNKRA